MELPHCDAAHLTRAKRKAAGAKVGFSASAGVWLLKIELADAGQLPALRSKILEPHHPGRP